MKNILMVVITAITAAAITMACGAPVVAQQPTTQVESATQVVVEATAQPTQVVATEGSYWSKSYNKGFKAIEYGCTRGWKAVDMPYGCVVVIDLTRKGYGHSGITGPFGVVIPRENGVTITGADSEVYVAAKAKTYIFVVIDDKGASVRHEFMAREALWDDELLRDFFETQMGGDVSTIWREGVSDIDID